MAPKKGFLGLLCAVLLFVFLLSGCVSDEDDPTGPGSGGDGGADDGNGGNGDGDGDEGSDDGGDGMGDEDATADGPCTVSLDAVTDWSHSGPAVPDGSGDPTADPLMVFAQTANVSFTVPEGTQTLYADLVGGDHVTLGWSVSLMDPTGSEQVSFSGSAGPGGPTVTGAELEDGGTVSSPVPGEWTLATSVTGYFDSLILTISADVCQ